MSNTITALKWRYATKKFDASKKLSEEKINVLKEAFDLTATSYGLQPLKLIVIRNDRLQEQLVPISMDQLQVRDASHVLVICREKDISANYINSYFDRVVAMRDTPRAILEPFQNHLLESFSQKNPDDVGVWMEKQAYLALGNLLTVCALEEIDSCPMEGFEPDRYDEALGLSKMGLRSVLVLPVGYRAEDDMFAEMKKVRRGVDSVVIDIN